MSPQPPSRTQVVIGITLFLLLLSAATLWIRSDIKRNARSNPSAALSSPQFPAGQIVRVPARDMVVLNRGLGDAVEQGMTFDVYDRQAGIPPPGADGKTPPGKASIEVIRIGPGFCECRVIRKDQGSVVVQGDVVVVRPYAPK